MILRIIFCISIACLSIPTLAKGQICTDNSIHKKRIAFTFDDAPTRSTEVFTGHQRTQKILSTLKTAGVSQAAFFTIAGQINDNSHQRLLAYAEAGHIIANHSNTHPNLHNIGADAFLTDVKSAHTTLSKYPNFKPLFRFPYLNEGSSIKERNQVRAALKQLGYQQAYVTIDNFDFYVNILLREVVTEKRDIDHAKISQFYVGTIMDAINHYHQIACQWLSEVPDHVLLLHENDAAALYLDDLIETLKREHWEIIPVTQAYQDPIAKTLPDTLLLGQGRVAALASIAGAPARLLRHQGENIVYLREQFEAIMAAMK